MPLGFSIAMLMIVETAALVLLVHALLNGIGGAAIYAPILLVVTTTIVAAMILVRARGAGDA